MKLDLSDPKAGGFRHEWLHARSQDTTGGALPGEYLAVEETIRDSVPVSWTAT